MLQLLANASGQNQQASAEAAAAVGAAAGLGAMACYFAVAIGFLIVILWLIYDAAKAADPKHRTMDPSMVWLLIIPIFNVFWNFRVFPAVSDSLAATLRDHGRSDAGDAGKIFGMCWSLLMVLWWILFIIGWVGGHAMAITSDVAASMAAFGIIGILRLLTDLALLVCVIIYIVKVQIAKSQIKAAGGTPAPPA